MQTKTSNWLSAYAALPLALRLPCEITRFKMQQFSAGEAAANTCFVDAKAIVEGSGAEVLELGGGEHLDARSSGFGPVALPVLRAQILAGYSATGVGLQRYAVVWRERPLPSHPRADISQVLVAKSLGNGEVGFVVGDKLGKRVFKGWASFHASNLT